MCNLRDAKERHVYCLIGETVRVETALGTVVVGCVPLHDGKGFVRVQTTLQPVDGVWSGKEAMEGGGDWLDHWLERHDRGQAKQRWLDTGGEEA